MILTLTEAINHHSLKTTVHTTEEHMTTINEMNIGDIVRQGDLYIERIADIPNDAQPVTAEDARVLAYGESGTHHHEVVGDCMILERPKVDADRPSAEALVTVDDATDLRERFLEVEKEVSLRIAHDERRHTPFTLGTGTYRTYLQREWAPEEIRRVAD